LSKHDLRPLSAAALIPDASLDLDREHRFDREIVAAVWRRQRAAAGLGYAFRPPPRLREAA
jgi:hypothetical protein